MKSRSVLKVSLLTGGADKPYALGLLHALISKGLTVDFIGSDELNPDGIINSGYVNFLNLRGNQDPQASPSTKLIRVLRYYARLLCYVTRTDSRIFHILWLNKFLALDRTFLVLYYKLLKKQVVYTAHNIDERERDGGNTLINKFSLLVFYRLVDHIFVHTVKMKDQLISRYNIAEIKVSIIPFGINNTLPNSPLTSAGAKALLNLGSDEKVILFFGNIAPYKGLEYAIGALNQLVAADKSYRLIIAGQVKACDEYWEKLKRSIKTLDLGSFVIKRIQYIPDEKVEVFFKAADVLVLPYRFVYQSGVLFLSYSFGLPVVAADVGSLRDDIVPDVTGLICRPDDTEALAEAIRRYFKSAIFSDLNRYRRKIIMYGNDKYSWDKVSTITFGVYSALAK